MCALLRHTHYSFISTVKHVSVFTGVNPQSSTVASVFWTWLCILFSLLALTPQGSLGLLIPACSKNTEDCVTQWDLGPYDFRDAENTELDFLKIESTLKC